jgi:hypothetical protein
LHVDTLKQLAYFETNVYLLLIKILLCFVEHDLDPDALDPSCGSDTVNLCMLLSSTV